jgi:hypothetical protein
MFNKNSDNVKKDLTDTSNYEQPKIKVTSDPVSLPEQVANLNSKLDLILDLNKKYDGKKFKLPGLSRSKLKKALKRKMLVVFVLGRNRISDSIIVENHEGYIVINGIPRPTNNFNVFLWQGKYPCIFLPEWELTPLGCEEYYKKYPNGISTADSVKLILGIAKSNQELEKKPINMKVWIIGGLIVIALLYVLFNKNIGM